MAWKDILYKCATGVFFLAVPFIACAQKTVITGKVYDAQTREPMPFVNIQLKNTTIGTSTDFEGNYKIITTVTSDSILVSYIGYIATAKAIKNHVTQQINIFFQPQ